ncbi:hypothetical protein V490_03445 [Pseudogymnoascus sp. VKM F-3557]|nr:hypothetical protein V490_03445 [Pseudogymnoascus sp. VKM F-3557]
MKNFIAASLLACCVTPSLAGVSNPLQRDFSLPTVDLGYEIHQATFNQSGQYYNFSNVRYAAPPVGKLRFAPPTSPKKSNKPVFNDGSNPVTCIQALPYWFTFTADWLVNGTDAFNISAGYQVPDIQTMPPQSPQMSEDCLFLDIMTPKKVFDNAKKGKKGPGKKSPGAPVMVWIHGGGYTLGSKVQYSPSAAGLIRASQAGGNDGVVWVGINYRLGSFGFLSGPTFKKNGGVPNAGLLDQRFALEWIQENIHLFGGDPKQVTVIGESAGGGSVMHQLTAYGGRKGKVPFHQAIVQSPGYQPMPSAKGQEAVFQKFLGVANVKNLDEARSLSAYDLQFANYKLIGESFPYGTFTFNPALDGDFVPALPGTLLREGKFDKSVNVMAGHNIQEGIQFMDPFAQTEDRFEENLRIYFPTITEDIVHYISKVLYPPDYSGLQGYNSPTTRSALMITEGFFTCNTNWLGKALKYDTYNYIFSLWPSLHGDDIWYTYYNGPQPLVKDNALAVTMQRYFTSFAQTGSPNST